jgi:hypothetical protein
MLGGSTPNPTSREEFVTAVLNTFGVTVPTLTIEQFVVELVDRGVSIVALVSGYDGESIELVRNPGRVRIAYELIDIGDGLFIRTVDEGATGIVTYTLVADNGRVLWQETVDSRGPALAWKLASVYPNPARSNIRLLLETDRGGDVLISLYDIRGALVRQIRRTLVRGSNTVKVEGLGGLSSGVYLVRVSGVQGHAQRKFMILR